MFKALLFRQVHNADGSSSVCDGYLRYAADLPFAPFVGLTIRDGLFSALIQEVAYDIPKALFNCFCESDGPDYAEPPHKRTKEEVEEGIADSVSFGWERCTDLGGDYDDAAAATFDREWTARERRLAGK